MMLHDRMVYGGIRTSKRFAKLSWFERDLFAGVLLIADDYGRFEADAETLRTVLYGPVLSKVSERDVQVALARFGLPGIELVKFYTVNGRGYGEVLNFRQTGLRKRRGIYPDEKAEVPPEPKLCPKEGRKEIPPSPPPAGGDSYFPSLPDKPKRWRRSPKPEELRSELADIKRRILEIRYPGGSAYPVVPSDEKAKILKDLLARKGLIESALKRAEHGIGDEHEN